MYKKMSNMFKIQELGPEEKNCDVVLKWPNHHVSCAQTVSFEGKWTWTLMTWKMWYIFRRPVYKRVDMPKLLFRRFKWIYWQLRHIILTHHNCCTTIVYHRLLILQWLERKPTCRSWERVGQNERSQVTSPSPRVCMIRVTHWFFCQLVLYSRYVCV